MALILGLAAAITYGAADFLGGLASKTTRVLNVVLVSQLLGSLVLIALFPFFAPVAFTAEGFAWGVASGVAGATGVAVFYKGLAIGRMGVVAPIAAVEAALIPVVFGLMRGERPSALASAGVVLALVAVALVSASGRTSKGEMKKKGVMASGVPHALAAGLGFGAFFILLDQAGDGSGLWPLVGARVCSVGLMGIAVLATRSWERPSRRALWMIAGAGGLDVAANLLYLLGTRQGLLSIVAVLTSMYPAPTVLLARVVLKERFQPIQSLGLAVAVLGVIAIALG